MDFDFNAPAPQVANDPFVPPQQTPVKSSKKGCAKCNLEHVAIYSLFIILKSGSPVLYFILLAVKVNALYILPAAVLITAMDEWFTHHIAGRRMVRLRYHIYGVDGKSYTHYEFDTVKKANKCEAITFWAFIWILPFFWILAITLTLIISVLSFNFLLMIFIFFQITICCIVIYRFMAARSARSLAIRSEKKTAHVAPAAGQQMETPPGAPVRQQADPFTF